MRKNQTSLDIASVVFAVIGALGLIFLSIFDAFDYPNVHWSMSESICRIGEWILF